MISTRSSREERKNSEFRRVFFWQLKSGWLGMAFYTAILLIFVPGLLMVQAYSQSDYYLNQNYWSETDTLETMLSSFAQYMASVLNSRLVLILLPIVLCFIVGWCINAFGFMHGRRSVDLFHALPVRRTPLLLGSYVAGLVFLYIPMALCFALCHAVGLYYHLPAPYSAAFIWQGFLIMVLMATAVYTSSMFFCVCSGTLLDAAISILALNLGWPVLVICIREILSLSLPGYSYQVSAEFASALSPYLAAFIPMGRSLIQSFLGNATAETYSSATGAYNVSSLFVLWWAALTILFLLGSLLYYTRRKSECAEDHFSFPVIRGILRFLVSAASGLGFGLIFGSLLDSNLAFFLGIVAGAFAAHLVGQMVWTHTLRKFWKTLPAYGLLLCCTALFLVLVTQGGLGFVTRLPAAEKVESVDSFSPTGVVDDSVESYFKESAYIDLILKDQAFPEITSAYSYSGSTGWIASVTPVFTEASDIQCMIDYHEALTKIYHGPYLPFEKGNTCYYTRFTYHLKNGQTMTRAYNLNLSEDTTDITEAEAKVIKLDAYTKLNVFQYQSAKHMIGIDVSMSNGGGEYYASAYNDNDDLTDEQKETLWNTLWEELNSPDFSIPVTYEDPNESEGEEYGTAYADASAMADTAFDSGSSALTLPDEVPETRAEAEAYFGADAGFTYTITMDSILFAELPQEMQDFIRSQMDDPDAEIDSAQSRGFFDIPECCTKTRDLMYAYSRENGYFYSYDGEDY